MPNTRTRAQKIKTATKRGNTARVTRLKGENTRRNPKTFTERSAGPPRPTRSRVKPKRTAGRGEAATRRATGPSGSNTVPQSAARHAKRKVIRKRVRKDLGIKKGQKGTAQSRRRIKKYIHRPKGDTA